MAQPGRLPSALFPIVGTQIARGTVELLKVDCKPKMAGGDGLQIALQSDDKRALQRASRRNAILAFNASGNALL
jgi:hypothetical protein